MNLIDIIVSAVSSSVLVGLVATAAGLAFKKTIEKGVEHKFNTALEELKSGLRIDEEKAKGELRSRDEKIAALQRDALSGMAARNAILEKRRLKALENLWVAIMDLTPQANLARSFLHLRMDTMLDYAERETEGEGLRRFAQVSLDSAGIQQATDVHPRTIDREQLFIPPLLWALYSAYRHIVTYPTLLTLMMSKGLPRKVLADPTYILDAAKAALPNMTTYIDQVGIQGLPNLIEPLRDELLRGITASLDNPDYDSRSIDRAGAILKAVAKAASEDAIAAHPLPEIVTGLPAK